MSIALSIKGLSKSYVLDNGTRRDALTGISLDVAKGSSIGIIGRNGAGKSTLLKILSGITLPTSGEAFVHGTFSSLLEVGTGFHPDLTGKENIFLNASIIGVTRKQVASQLAEIISFSGVGAQIDEPLRTYSSGMKLRLAFSVMAHLNTDIIALDEVLAVGDTQFQVQCIERIFGMRQAGHTILFVSHNLAAVRKLCDRVVVIDEGRVTFDGIPDRAIAHYVNTQSDSLNTERPSGFLRSVSSSCDERSADISITFDGIPSELPVDVGINLMDSDGNALIHFSNRFIGTELLPVNGHLAFTLTFAHQLKPGRYPLHVYLGQGGDQLEWTEHAAMLTVPPYAPYGFHDPDVIQAAVIRPFTISAA